MSLYRVICFSCHLSLLIFSSGFGMALFSTSEALLGHFYMFPRDALKVEEADGWCSN